MGEKKLLISVDEFKTIRLRCNHCPTAVVFALDSSDHIGEARCSSCGTLMADAHHVVNKYRDFFADLKRFAKGRDAMFEIAWRDA
jgi:transcription elongation factor Elf1